jgi:recombination protein RecA
MTGKKKKEEPTQDWDLVVAGIGKKFGKGLSLFQMNDNVQLLGVPPIPTMLAPLDYALGIFGLPQGRIVEVYGPESGAKTSIALHVVSAAQKLFPDRPVVYIDLEHALDPLWMRNLGVSFDNLWISQPDSGEEATQIALTAAESGAPSLIVMDSIAAIVPQKEIDGEMTDQQMGKVGAIMGKFCRKVISPLHRGKTLLLCTNQTRMKLGPMPGEERPGGKALRFFASQILRVRREKDILVNGEIGGIWVEVKVRKNKVAPPFRVANIPLLFEGGFSRKMALVDAAAGEGIITKAVSWYSYGEERLGQGALNVANNMSDEKFGEIYNKFKNLKLKGCTILEETEEEIPGIRAEQNLEEIIDNV